MTDEINKIQSQVKPGRQSEEVQKLRRKGLMKEISLEFRVKQGWRQRKHRRTINTIISQELRLSTNTTRKEIPECRSRVIERPVGNFQARRVSRTNQRNNRG